MIAVVNGGGCRGDYHADRHVVQGAYPPWSQRTLDALLGLGAEASVDGAESEVDGDDLDGESDDSEGEEVTVHAELPPVLRDFPVLIPPVGSNYETDQHKKLLVITESPYLPKHARYMDDEEWYAGSQESFVASGYLREYELAHLALRKNIAVGNEHGRWRSGGCRSHASYKVVNDTLKGILGTEGIREYLATRVHWRDGAN